MSINDRFNIDLQCTHVDYLGNKLPVLDIKSQLQPLLTGDLDETLFQAFDKVKRTVVVPFETVTANLLDPLLSGLIVVKAKYPITVHLTYRLVVTGSSPSDVSEQSYLRGTTFLCLSTSPLITYNTSQVLRSLVLAYDTAWEEVEDQVANNIVEVFLVRTAVPYTPEAPP